MRRKSPRVVDGLRDGAAALALPSLGTGIGEGLDRIAHGAEWLSGGRLAVPQMCPISGCRNGPFSSLYALRHHMDDAHPELSPRQKTEACDTARITCRKAVAALRSVTP